MIDLKQRVDKILHLLKYGEAAKCTVEMAELIRELTAREAKLVSALKDIRELYSDNINSAWEIAEDTLRELNIE